MKNLPANVTKTVLRHVLLFQEKKKKINTENVLKCYLLKSNAIEMCLSPFLDQYFFFLNIFSSQTDIKLIFPLFNSMLFLHHPPPPIFSCFCQIDVMPMVFSVIKISIAFVNIYLLPKQVNILYIITSGSWIISIILIKRGILKKRL